jgi:hypothetical protein
VFLVSGFFFWRCFSVAFVRVLVPFSTRSFASPAKAVLFSGRLWAGRGAWGIPASKQSLSVHDRSEDGMAAALPKRIIKVRPAVCRRCSLVV